MTREDDASIVRLEARIEAMSARISILSEKMVLMAEQYRNMETTVTQIEKETSGLNRLANRGMGIIIALALIGGALGGFWERLVRLIGH